MKKTIIASILGVAALTVVSSAHSQGLIIFGNYAFGGSGFQSAPVTFGTEGVPVNLQGLTVGPTFTADLWFGGSTGASYVDTGLSAAFGGSANGDSGGGAGFIVNSQGNQVTINSYTSGNAYFKIFVTDGTYSGFSAPIVLSALVTPTQAAGGTPVGDMFGNNVAAISPITGWTVVAPVPEPSTLALAGLGGFGMLMALRRKKA